jgi:hypothetical protein
MVYVVTVYVLHNQMIGDSCAHQHYTNECTKHDAR